MAEKEAKNINTALKGVLASDSTLIGLVDGNVRQIEVNKDGGVTGFNPAGEVKQGDKRAVSGEEVLNSFGFYNVNNSDVISRTFAEAVVLVPKVMRKDGFFMYFIDENDKSRLMQFVSTNAQDDSRWTEPTAWRVILGSEVVNTYSFDWKGNAIATRLQLTYRNRGLNVVLIYNNGTELIIEKTLTNERNATPFSSNNNWVRLNPKSEIVKVNTTPLTIEIKDRQNLELRNKNNFTEVLKSNLITKTISTILGKSNIERFGIHNVDNGIGNIYNELLETENFRFKDINNNILPFLTYESKGIDIIRDSTLKSKVLAFNDSTILTSGGRENENIYISTDNGVNLTEIIQNQTLIGITPLGAFIASDAINYYRHEKINDIWEQSIIMPLDGSIGNFESFATDSKGNIYLSKYQENPNDAVVYKSVDDGKTFSIVYQDLTKMHVHNIYIDDQDWIFVGIDGAVDQEQNIVSKDYGVTWEVIPIPYRNRDYGITYSGLDNKGNRFYLGCGESSIKGGYSLYRSTDLINFTPVVASQSRVPKVFKFKNHLYAPAMCSNANRIAQLWRSSDYGINWSLVYCENWTDDKSSGAGMRYISNVFKTSSGKDCVAIGGTGGGEYFKTLLLIDDAQSDYKLCLVNKKGATQVKFESGYLLPYLNNENDFVNKNVGNITSYKFNENNGDYTENYTYNKLIEIESDEYEWNNKIGNRFSNYYPYISPLNSGLKLNSGFIRNYLNKDLNIGVTVVFMVNLNTAPNGMLWGDPLGFNIKLENDRINIYEGGAVKNYYSIAKWMFTDQWVRFNLTLDTVRKKSFFVDNDNYIREFDYNNIPAKVNWEYLLGSNIGNGCQVGVAEIDVYSPPLSHEEYIRNYY